MALTMHEAARVLHGELHGAGAHFLGLSTDTRTLRPHNLFVALQGPNFDGHAFVEEAARKGAAGAAVAHPVESALPQIAVEDTRLALGRLAAHWRSRFDIPLVAVTGSNGKTTVKEMIAAILSQRGRVLATRGNLNNDIGVPLTLARLDGAHTHAVIEMGANHPGEIGYLTGLARPTVALLTNAGPAHLKGFGSLEGVARAKGEIFAGLADDGVAVVNRDDRFFEYWAGLNAGRRMLDFGFDPDAAVHGEWRPEGTGGRLRLATPAGPVEIGLPLPGRHNAINAMAATAAALAAGAGLDDVRAGLESMQGVAGRLQLHRAGGRTLIDDSYNANPASLAAALEVLAQFDPPRWVVLGDMGELGPDAAALHTEAGERIRAAGVDGLLCVGTLATAAARAFGAGAQAFADIEALTAVLDELLPPFATVLVKGSRAAAMERVVEWLVARAGPERG